MLSTRGGPIVSANAALPRRAVFLIGSLLADVVICTRVFFMLPFTGKWGFIPDPVVKNAALGSFIVPVLCEATRGGEIYGCS